MKLSQINQAYISNSPSVAAEPQNISPRPAETKKDGNSRIALALAGLAAIAVAGVAIARHKGAGRATEEASKLIKDVQFDKGNAILKETGEKFSGKICDTLKNGDKITLEYVDGVISSSKREGAKSFEKVFSTAQNGDKLVEITKDGTTVSKNLTKLKNHALTQKEYKELIEAAKNGDIGRGELIARSNKLKGLTEQQSGELKEIIAQKPYLASEVTFDKGVPHVERFGTTISPSAVETKLPNGDRVVMEYDALGNLKKSTRTGEKEFVKVYNKSFTENKVDITAGGKTETFDIKRAQNHAKYAQERFKELSENDIATIEDLSRLKESCANGGLNSSQKRQLDEVLTYKKQRIPKAKEEATKQAAEFEKSFGSLSDKELDKIRSAGTAEQSRYLNLAQERNLQRPFEHNGELKELLTDDELAQYELHAAKSKSAARELTKRENKTFETLLKKEGDKPVTTPYYGKYATEEEIGAFNQYYDDYSCNWHFRKNDGIEYDHTKIMDKVFKEKAPALEDDAVTYRAVHAGTLGNSDTFREYINSIKDGAVLRNAGYTSTSTSCTDAQFKQFARSAKEDGVLMRIHLPKGTRGVLGGYNEYLLPRNAQLKVNGTNIIDGVKVADCEYILP